MSQRAYCDQPHPGGDAEADRWCEMHHRPTLPRIAPPARPWTFALVDAETGETVIRSHRGRPTDPDAKGWILRWRSAHKKKTGRKLVVVLNDEAG